MKIIFPAPLLLVIILSLFSPSKSDSLGFSMDLIHRDSPPSPFHNPSLTSFEHLSNGLKRSHSRANHFISLCKKPRSASSELISSSGVYLMKITLGTPKFNIFAIADTGSDLIWTQCAPCTQCYKQKAPFFDPKKSSTYKQFTCNSGECLSLSSHHCNLNKTCEYSLTYGDKSYSEGTLASETLTLNSVSFSGITFGCGSRSGGTYSEDGSGLVGLGGGPNSLISQLNYVIKGKFSYCLVPLDSVSNTSSKVHFGKNAVVSGHGVVSTPIVPIKIKTFYGLTLKAISVGKHRVKLANSTSDGGNMIIDSGTTLTYLPSAVYPKFESLVQKAMGNKTVDDPMGVLNLCYRISDKPSFPKIKLHFTGAKIKLKPKNTFISMDDDVTCLAFTSGGVTRIGILGNVAQTNFKVGYDLVKKTVSFKPFKC